jgi:hypothetical protein
MSKKASVHNIPSMISGVVEDLRRIQEVAWGTPYHEDSNQSIRSAMGEVDKAIHCLFNARDQFMDAAYPMHKGDN